jgi:hypothetical protein
VFLSRSAFFGRVIGTAALPGCPLPTATRTGLQFSDLAEEARRTNRVIERATLAST